MIEQHMIVSGLKWLHAVAEKNYNVLKSNHGQDSFYRNRTPSTSDKTLAYLKVSCWNMTHILGVRLLRLVDIEFSLSYGQPSKFKLSFRSEQYHFDQLLEYGITLVLISIVINSYTPSNRSKFYHRFIDDMVTHVLLEISLSLSSTCN